MDGRVLVAYASKYGATAGIAERIGQVLRDADLSVDVLAADQVDSLADYRAVILGSAVSMGRWRRESARLLTTNETILRGKPVWLFSSGPMGEGDAEELTEGWRFPRKLQPIADRIGPRDIVVFHGAVDVEKLGFFDKWILKKVEAPVGDFRDWAAITAWAEGIVAALTQTPT